MNLCIPDNVRICPGPLHALGHHAYISGSALIHVLQILHNTLNCCTQLQHQGIANFSIKIFKRSL